ncbi:hypothetical protein CH275_11970 [Rhodococcus sp. 06-235-1A]|nr:hypothetical protein CH275_11970 [Rhodococcus sp. 06-235-1A]
MHMTHSEHRLESFEEYYGYTPAHLTMRVHSQVLRWGLSWADAEDVTQETMVALVTTMQRLPQIEFHISVIAWVYGVAAHKFRDHLNRKERIPKPHPDLDQLDFAHLDDVSAIDDDVVARATEVLSRLDLSPRRRQVADMLWNPWDLDFNAVPQAFVAKELGMALGTVKSTVSAIKAQFRTALAVD